MSVDDAARTVSFDVDGETVVRSIPDKFDGTIDDYLKALADGLVIEYAEVEKTDVTATKYAAGEIVSTDAVAEDGK